MCPKCNNAEDNERVTATGWERKEEKNSKKCQHTLPTLPSSRVLPLWFLVHQVCLDPQQSLLCSSESVGWLLRLFSPSTLYFSCSLSSVTSPSHSCFAVSHRSPTSPLHSHLDGIFCHISQIVSSNQWSSQNCPETENSCENSRL